MVFGTIADDSKKSGEALTLFHKKFSDVINDYKSVNDDKIGFRKLRTGLSSSYISKTDLESLNSFATKINSYSKEADFAEKANAELEKSFSNSTSAVRKNAKSIVDLNSKLNSGKITQDDYNARLQAYTTVSKKASVATKVFGTALRTALNIGITLLINAAIEGISKLMNKEKEAEEEAKRLKEEQEQRRQEAIESLKETNEEIKAINDLTERYIKLYSTTNDITTIKGELSSIQDEIVDKYGKEADGIDVVNGKLSENLEYMRELEKKENSQWLRDNYQAIKDAEKFIQEPSTHGGGATSFVVADSSLEDYEYKSKETKANIYKKQLKKNLEKSGTIDFFNLTDNQLDLWDGSNGFYISFDLVDGLSIEESKKALTSYLDAYEKLYKFAESKFDDDPFDLEQKYIALKSYVEKYIESADRVSEANTRQAQIDGFNSIEKDRTEYKQYKEYIDELKTLSQEMNNPENTPAVVYKKQLELDDVKEKISDLVSEFPILSEEAERVFNNVGLSIDGTIASTDNLSKAFFETYDEIQKETLTKVDTIKKAMETMLNGGELSNDEAWNIWSFDQNNLIQPYLDANGKLKISYQDLIILKDDLINKEKERLKIEIETAKQNKENLQKELAVVNEQIDGETILANSKPSNAFVENKPKQAELKNKIAEWGDQIKKNEILLKTLDSSLGNIISSETKIKLLQQDINDLQEEINDLQSKADDYEKAFNHKIDGVIDSLESEKEVLDSELDSLKSQLETLENQKEELENIIEDYKQVADIVSETVDKEKELLEEQREAQEKAYNERIDALKKAHDKQEEENELTEKQVALQEKLQALDKAKKNKVSTYSSERGWYYDVNKEEVISAQKDVDDAQKNIDDYLSEKAYEAEIKAIEDERDTVLENYDIQIKAYEDYVEQWKEILEEETNAENERLAQEILGADWREKIKNKDIQILNEYNSSFNNYNSQLSNLVNTEIANLQKSIEIKESEIKAKQEVIDQWQKYKSEVQDAINSIKSANESYMQYLNGIVLNENSSFEQRNNTLATFVGNYRSYIDEINSKSNELEWAQAQMDALAESAQNVSGALGAFSFDIIENMTAMITGSISNIFDFVSNPFPSRFLIDDILRGDIQPYSSGGVNDYTGLAMLHGTRSNPELILNNNDVAKLYKSIHDSSFIDTMMSNIYDGLVRSIPINNNSTSHNNNTINIDRMEIKANDPMQFHAQFQKELSQHYRFALSESKVW